MSYPACTVQRAWAHPYMTGLVSALFAPLALSHCKNPLRLLFVANSVPPSAPSSPSPTFSVMLSSMRALCLLGVATIRLLPTNEQLLRLEGKHPIPPPSPINPQFQLMFGVKLLRSEEEAVEWDFPGAESAPFSETDKPTRTLREGDAAFHLAHPPGADPAAQSRVWREMQASVMDLNGQKVSLVMLPPDDEEEDGQQHHQQELKQPPQQEQRKLEEEPGEGDASEQHEPACSREDPALEAAGMVVLRLDATKPCTLSEVTRARGIVRAVHCDEAIRCGSHGERARYWAGGDQLLSGFRSSLSHLYLSPGDGIWCQAVAASWATGSHTNGGACRFLSHNPHSPTAQPRHFSLHDGKW